MNSQPSNGEFSSPHFAKCNPRIVLSVDDEPAILVTRQQILEAAGYEVLSAADGEQALLLFLAQPVELVLLDYVMPGKDGGSVAQEMKRHKPSVPIVLVSGSPVPHDALTCIDCRVDKGQGPVLLLETIRQYLIPISGRKQPSNGNGNSQNIEALEFKNNGRAKL